MLLKRIREYLLDQDVCEWCYAPFTFLFFAFLAIFFTCSYQIAWVYTVERNVTLSEPFIVCQQPLANRCRTEYLAIASNGQSVFAPYLFEFGNNVLHSGLRIEKAKYSFMYRLDGNETLWPNLPGLSLAWMVGLVGITMWFLLAGPKHFGRYMRRGRD